MLSSLLRVDVITWDYRVTAAAAATTRLSRLIFLTSGTSITGRCQAAPPEAYHAPWPRATGTFLPSSSAIHHQISPGLTVIRRYPPSARETGCSLERLSSTWHLASSSSGTTQSPAWACGSASSGTWGSRVRCDRGYEFAANASCLVSPNRIGYASFIQWLGTLRGTRLQAQVISPCAPVAQADRAAVS